MVINSGMLVSSHFMNTSMLCHKQVLAKSSAVRIALSITVDSHFYVLAFIQQSSISCTVTATINSVVAKMKEIYQISDISGNRGKRDFKAAT